MKAKVVLVVLATTRRVCSDIAYITGAFEHGGHNQSISVHDMLKPDVCESV